MDQPVLRIHVSGAACGYRRQSPLVRKWLRSYGIDASMVASVANSDRLTKSDIERFMAGKGADILRATDMS